MKEFSLPNRLEEEYNSIGEKFKLMYENYNSQTDISIPEDKEFMKRIIGFIINVIDYIIDNYDEINILEYQDFLGYYHFDFLYGPNGDDMNYLDSSENNIDGKSLQDFCFELRDVDFEASREKLEEIKSRYVQLLEKFE